MDDLTPQNGPEDPQIVDPGLESGRKALAELEIALSEAYIARFRRSEVENAKNGP